MGLILDTCVLIRAEKQGSLPDLRQWTEEKVYISAITASEMLMGLHRAKAKTNRLKRAAFIDMILARIPVLDFTLEVARIHAEIYAALAEQGQMIGAHDFIIAATALTHGYMLLTYNQREFIRVPGLKLLDTP